MKKLIFRKIFKETVIFFMLMSLILGLIVWTLQAVNYLDYITQDGHGFKTYAWYTIFNFPKIVHRLIPFVFFISVFFIITNYELKNELLIFWTHGISKINFVNNLLFLSIVLFFFQIVIGGFISPLSQYKARSYLKNSNIDFFSSLIKEGKFINAVTGLTIFINSKNDNGSFSNIFIDDSSKDNSRMIYAKDGNLIDKNNKKVFRLYKGKVLNKDKQKINTFEFNQIDFSLSEYSTNTILVPKIQEVPSQSLINCSLKIHSQNSYSNKDNYFTCAKSILEPIDQELLKRFYKPLFIPIIALACCLLIIIPKDNPRYKKNRMIIFFSGFIILLFSETGLRYASMSETYLIIYLVLPWILFTLIYFILYKKVRYV